MIEFLCSFFLTFCSMETAAQYSELAQLVVLGEELLDEECYLGDVLDDVQQITIYYFCDAGLVSLEAVTLSNLIAESEYFEYDENGVPTFEIFMQNYTPTKKLYDCRINDNLYIAEYRGNIDDDPYDIRFFVGQDDHDYYILNLFFPEDDPTLDKVSSAFFPDYYTCPSEQTDS